MTLVVLDAAGTKQNMSTTTDASGNLVGSTALTDPVTGNKQTISQLHNSDKQNLSGGTLYGALESGTMLLIDPVTGLADRAREVGSDNAPPIGIEAAGAMLLAATAVNSGTGAVGAPGAATITPAAMSGTFQLPAGGQGWSIQVGSAILYDVGGGNQELVEVTAVTSTTFTASFAKTHSAGVPMLVYGYYQSRNAPGQPGVAAVNAEGFRSTYHYFSAGNALAATPTDVFTIGGSASKTIRIKQIILSGIAGTAGQFVWNLVRRSTLDTGGTSTNPAALKHDPLDPAAAATLTLYTVNPGALGTVVGTPRGGRLFHNLTTAQPDKLVFDFCRNQDKPFILRGATDVLAINGAAGTLPAGATLDIEIEWEEDNS